MRANIEQFETDRYGLSMVVFGNLTVDVENVSIRDGYCYFEPDLDTIEYDLMVRIDRNLVMFVDQDRTLHQSEKKAIKHLYQSINEELKEHVKKYCEENQEFIKRDLEKSAFDDAI